MYAENSLTEQLHDTFVDNFDNFDDYNEAVENYESEFLGEQAKRAVHRRHHGLRKLEEIASFRESARRAAETSGDPIEVIYKRMFKNNPHHIHRLREYVANRDMQPSNNFDNLCAQVAHARAEHIGEKMDLYGDADNFYQDGDNFFWDSKERKEFRRARRKAKFARRLKRRQLKADLEEARLNREIAEAKKPIPEEQTTEEGTQESAETTSGEGYNKPIYRINTKKRGFDTVNSPEGQEVMNLNNPTEEQAHAEIIGEESDGEGFDGDNYDDFLPFLAGAIELGTKVLSGAKEKGVTADEIKKLLRRKSAPASSKAAADSLPPKNFGAALNAGIKTITDTVTKQKKQEFLKDNAVYIVLGVVALFGIGYLIGRK